MLLKRLISTIKVDKSNAGIDEAVHRATAEEAAASFARLGDVVLQATSLSWLSNYRVAI